LFQVKQLSVNVMPAFLITVWTIWFVLLICCGDIMFILFSLLL